MIVSWADTSDSRSDATGCAFAVKYGCYATKQRFTNISLSDTHTFSSSFLVTIRFGQSRMNWSDTSNGPDVATPAGLTAAFPYTAFGLARVPDINISSGTPAMGQGIDYYGPANLYAVPVDFRKGFSDDHAAIVRRGVYARPFQSQ